MRRSKRQKPPSIHPSTSSSSGGDRSPYCSSVLEDWDADDEDFMSSRDFLPSRPLSLAIPSGTYCPRRPTLQEVLANTAPPPWTLSAFMAYLSQNHCLETLEFTMDASRYRKHFNTMMERCQGHTMSSDGDDCDYVRMLWQKLLDAYITPDGPREVNLPSDVRHELMALPNLQTPPNPAVLDNAVRIIYELMDESVLVPFLNSVSAVRGPYTRYSSPWASSDNMSDMVARESLDDGALSWHRDQSPPISGSSFDIFHNPMSPRQSHRSATIGRPSSNRISAHLPFYSAASVVSSDTNELTMTDDSGNSPSPSTSALEPMTPPTTPPTSDIGTSPGTSPRNSRVEGSGWKKMGAKLGWKKSRPGPGSNAGSHQGRYPIVAESNTEDDNML
ncbi:MAG: hypothetical protein M1818_006703 [Claussenomyces sp. TS43310]|nr:MAG: hypothetical protein M1818_006703 [Claussenomyces sp. TS43310]